MPLKIKQIAFFLIIYFFVSFSLIWATEEKNSFAIDENLEKKIWHLAAFLIPNNDNSTFLRKKLLFNFKDLSNTIIILNYGDFFSPFPSSISIYSWPIFTKNPKLIYFKDKVPFGGENLQVKSFSFAKANTINKQITQFNLYEKYLTEIILNLDFANKVAAFNWEEIKPGFLFSKSKIFFGSRYGDNNIYVAKINPTFFTVNLYSEIENNVWIENPANVKNWALRLTEPLILINGGQYYPDRNYIGIFKKNGEFISEKEHKVWQGFLVSKPINGGGLELAILDKSLVPDIDLKLKNYNNVMQSFMLIDSLGQIRVKDSAFLASRTAIAQDKDNNILFIMVPGAISLYDFSIILLNSGLNIKQAIGLDGGFEAQLMLRNNMESLIYTGSFSISPQRPLFAPGYTNTLPTIIAVEEKNN